ncbi:MAG: DGQHR domain-containing protein DpdB [Gemmatimonadota bacterium]|jgi:DGQHR domain-containing protein
MPRKTNAVIRRRANVIEQNTAHPVYQFTLTGDEILQIAEISRVSRDDAGKLIGYQRPEVKRHVEDIVAYLNGDNVVFCNSIILALSSKVRFVKSRGPQVDDGEVASGILEIPVPGRGETKPGWIVDGQQRTMALSKSRRSAMRVPVNAFIADDVASQRDQFLRVNNTKPLPRGLITELLPEVGGPLPSNLAPRRIPSAIADQLHQQPASPFHGLIKRSSSSSAAKQAAITDTSIVKMIEESLATPSGCLFPYRNIATGETDMDTIWAILITYWEAVKQTFPEAWGRTPQRSRLMHGVGIRSMGRLMDKVMPAINPQAKDAVRQASAELALVVPVCHWTNGRWEELGGVAWNELQNVPRHIKTVSNLLIRTYVQAKSRGA